MADPSPSPLHLSPAALHLSSDPAFAATLRPSDRPSEPDHYDRSLPRPRPDRTGAASSFLPHAAHIGRHFDEDEQKPFAR
ncbi:hypothetical protein OPV22_027779 [Ensete ventricosum]|uniref:Uncharacterized protein n=1 Tax=Ensete ventricosum TaxID=4639 RepID=A0AAV8P3B4_ENSVE|nr:hypothetical protein OPV22_027779 [Ensete ventricosum]